MEPFSTWPKGRQARTILGAIGVGLFAFAASETSNVALRYVLIGLAGLSACVLTTAAAHKSISAWPPSHGLRFITGITGACLFYALALEESLSPSVRYILGCIAANSYASAMPIGLGMRKEPDRTP